jgi:urease accessory protein
MSPGSDPGAAPGVRPQRRAWGQTSAPRWSSDPESGEVTLESETVTAFGVAETAMVANDALQRSPGSGSLQIARTPAGSVVTRAWASSPLRFLTPRNHGHAAWIFTSTFGGGLVDGDALTIGIDVAPGASALLATQAATKVYRSRCGTSVDLAATIHAGGLLAVAPDPVVCFAASRYRQIQHFDLEDTANLVLVDWMTSGRRASGERWQFDRYESRVRVRRGGRLALLDALTLTPDEGDLRRRMGRFDTLCMIALIGPSLEAHAARIVSQVSALAITRRASILVGASPLDGGCVVKLAAASAEDVARTVRQFLDFVPALLGDDPWARKW